MKFLHEPVAVTRKKASVLLKFRNLRTRHWEIFLEKVNRLCAKSKYPNNKMLSLKFASAEKKKVNKFNRGKNYEQKNLFLQVVVIKPLLCAYCGVSTFLSRLR